MVADATEEKVSIAHNGLLEIVKNPIFMFSLNAYHSCRSKIPVRQHIRTQHGERTKAQNEYTVITTFPENSTTQSQNFMDGIRYFETFHTHFTEDKQDFYAVIFSVKKDFRVLSIFKFKSCA